MNKPDIAHRALGMPFQTKLMSGDAVWLVCAALILSLTTIMFRIALIW